MESRTAQDVNEYTQFAQDTYEQIKSDVQKALQADTNLPLLVVSGERHTEIELDEVLAGVIPDKYENPALAAAYTHISAIHAAGELVGKDNIVVSIEMSQSELTALTELVQNHTLFLSEDTYNLPIMRALSYAIENQYEVVATDPISEPGSGQERYDAEIEKIGQIALRTQDRPDVVVHMGGAAHIGTLQGYSREELIDNGKHLTRNTEANPFEGIYSNQLFYSTAPITASMSLGLLFDGSDNYYNNPKNATQINPPGKMEDVDIRNIERQVQGLPMDMRTEEEILASSMIQLTEDSWQQKIDQIEDAMQELEAELPMADEVNKNEANQENQLLIFRP